MGTVDLIDHGRDQTRGVDWTLWRGDPCVRPDHVHRHGHSSLTWRYLRDHQGVAPGAAAAWGSIRGVPETEGGPRARYPVDHSAAMAVVFYGEQTF